jgi:hypothetical protein
MSKSLRPQSGGSKGVIAGVAGEIPPKAVWLKRGVSSAAASWFKRRGWL